MPSLGIAERRAVFNSLHYGRFVMSHASDFKEGLSVGLSDP